MARVGQLIGCTGWFPRRHWKPTPSGGILLAGIASLAIHGSLVFVAGLSGAGSNLSLGQAVQSTSHLEVRLISQVDPQQSTAAGSEPVAVAPPTALLEEQRVHAPSQGVVDSGAPTVDTGKLQASLPVEPADGYLLRSALSIAPTPLAEVPLAWPAGLIPVGRLIGIFWLYIDETGKVDRLVSDGPDLPPQLEEISRSAFLATRFDPGQIDGRAVKSLIRIEVEFDNRPSAAPVPNVVSEQLL